MWLSFMIYGNRLYAHLLPVIEFRWAASSVSTLISKLHVSVHKARDLFLEEVLRKELLDHYGGEAVWGRTIMRAGPVRMRRPRRFVGERARERTGVNRVVSVRSRLVDPNEMGEEHHRA